MANKKSYQNLNKAFDRWVSLAPFVTEMVKKLEANKKEKGGREGWINDDPAALAERVLEETKELQEALTANDGEERTLSEAADVANMAMMVADASGLLEKNSGEKKERRKIYGLFDGSGLCDATMGRGAAEAQAKGSNSDNAALANSNHAPAYLKVEVVECYEVKPGEKIFTKNQLARMEVLLQLIGDAEYFSEITGYVKELTRLARKGVGP